MGTPLPSPLANLYNEAVQELQVGAEAAGGTDDASGSDGTPAPTAVNTGSPITDSVNISLLAAAIGMLVLAGVRENTRQWQRDPAAHQG